MRRTVLALSLLVLVTGCSRQPAGRAASVSETAEAGGAHAELGVFGDPDSWVGDAVLRYQLITKDHFESATSYKAWGNFAHDAEVCLLIRPAEDYEASGEFVALMRPDCSFWNKIISPVGRAARLGLAAVGAMSFGGRPPDWYILQHEQIHFAIAEVATRRLNQKIAAIPVEKRTDGFLRRVYEITLRHTDERHEAFDSETSGTYNTFLIEKWTRLLEREMAELCDEGQECRVRNYGEEG